VILEQLSPGAHKTYLVADEETGKSVLVDPVLDGVDAYMARIAELKLSLSAVVDTHSHADHVSGCEAIRGRTGCEYVMHERSPSSCVTRRVAHGDILTVGDLPLDVLHTPGHAADGMSLIVEGRILTGDALLIGSAGRSDLPGGDPDEHWHTLLHTLGSFPDSTLFFPGHDFAGRDFSSLGNERRHNPHFEHKDRYTYVKWQEGLRGPVPQWVNRVLEANFEGKALKGDVPDGDGVEGCDARKASPAAAPAASKGREAPKEIGVINLQGRIERGKNPVLILDVRDEEGFKGPLGHIEGAYHLPKAELGKKLKELQQFKSSEVVTVSKTGNSSMDVAATLLAKGFEDVKSLRGGMIAWRARGYRVDR
jgi:sulfur dioxygenase